MLPAAGNIASAKLLLLDYLPCFLATTRSTPFQHEFLSPAAHLHFPLQEAVDARLAELVSLVDSRLFQTATGHLGIAFRRDWSVVDPGAFLYGHELECMYFVMAAARQLATAGAGALPPAVLDAVRQAQQLSLEVGVRASQEAYDGGHGRGFWTDGRGSKPGSGGPMFPTKCGQSEGLKTWWVQVRP